MLKQDSSLLEITTYPDLRSYLTQVRERFPNKLLEISEEIDLDYSSTAIALELEGQGRFPVILLKQLKGSNFEVVANLFASRELIAHSIGTTTEKFYAHFAHCLEHLLPAEKVASGPVQEVVFEQSADLGKLPIPRHFEEDAGPYITAGMIAAQDPDTGVGNLAYARLQVKGEKKMGVSLHSRQHLWDYHRRAKLAGRDLPVAVVIGAHPAVMIAGAARMGIDEDEYDLAGALLRRPLPICKCRTVDVYVPANAEIVIEGHILADEEEEEGPFGEYTGYTTGRSTNNVMRVTAITMRQAPLFVDIVPGNSSEHLTLGRFSKEAWVYQKMKEALPYFVDFYYPSSGTHFHCYVRIDKTAEGQAKQAAELLLGLDHYVKLVVVVDKDIDPSREPDVLWAVATRVQADRDVDILSGVICNRLDPSSDSGMSAKMLVDATAPLDTRASRIKLPEAAVHLAKRLVSSESTSSSLPAEVPMRLITN